MRKWLPLLFAGACLIGLSLGSLPAQTPAATPDENPEGNTGALKAQITTGGSYDAHSGNATRSVNDLHVPGALGIYGLDFTRHWNSVPNDHDNPAAVLPISFGFSGWSHSWEWHAQEEDYSENIDPMDDQSEQIFTTAITITFPDGHATRYKITRSNRGHGYPPYWAPPDPRCGPPYTVPEQNGFLAGGPVYDVLADMAADGSSFWLYRADGGSVRFIGGPGFYYATEVLDPHGFSTQLEYNEIGQLIKVTQEGGRWLTITWGNGVITRVETGGYAGSQGVDYQYAQTGNFGTLWKVFYPEGAQAVYTYANCYGDLPCGSNDSPFPMLKIADDPHFAGAMTKIRYTYRGSDCLIQNQPAPGFEPYYNARLDYYLAPATSIAAEKSDYANQFGPITVSSFGIGCFNGTRTENSGLGGWRTFYFGHSAGYQGNGEHLGYQLIKLTDFTNQNPDPANLPFERQNWTHGQAHQVWDGRGIETKAVVTPGDASGQPGEIHHVTADGSYQVFNRVSPGNSDAQDFTKIPNRYNRWLFSHRDERGLVTTYRRDSRRRVVDIIYPDTNSEHFTYNDLNQVVTHTLPSGAVVNYAYDSTTHRLLTESNSIDGWDARRDYIYDDATHPDLVHKVMDARARSSGAPYSTRMEYDGGNRIIEVHYAPTPDSADPHVTYGFDDHGNCTSITDEMGHIKSYLFDDYRRCIRYTEQLDAQTSRQWDWLYDRWIDGVGGSGSYTHTKNEWRIQLEPPFNAAGERRMTARAHDLQNRIVVEQTGWVQRPTWIGDWYWSNDGETHRFEYDENGQKKTDILYIAPENRVTTFTYDLRNRLWKTIEPLNRITENQYDVTGNKTLVIFPDSTTQQWLDYTPFGQAERFIDERGNTTNLNHQWGPMKKLASVVTHRDRDDGGTEDQTTTFSYDEMGRPTQVLFPDWSHENNSYECGNGASYHCDQVHTWRTRKGQLKTISYDARGREISHTWSDDTPGITRIWDPANRLTNITNSVSSIDYDYDYAGQPKYERTTIAGAGDPAQITYDRYPDGAVSRIVYPTTLSIRHDYTPRGQLAATGWSDSNNNWLIKFAIYNYLADGKVDHQDYANGVRTEFGYDGRGMTSSVWHHRGSPYQNYSWRYYWRDERDRIVAFQKSQDSSFNPMEDGRGEHYYYDGEGELTDAYYNAADPLNNPNSWVREDHFNYDALGNRRSWDHLASRGWMNFTRKDNGLNQYRAWWNYSIINYDDDIGEPWGSPGQANGVIMQDGWITAGFNALNQPMYIWSANVGWTNFGYDPLGRCVKRWRDGTAATYLYYDGWGLIHETSTISQSYILGNRVDEIVAGWSTANNQWIFRHSDARGHCTLLTDWGGNPVEQYEYDAFGKPYVYNASGAALPATAFDNRFLFTGREWLSDLRLYDYRNRLYQPELGRFMQPDPKQFAAGDYNLYRYCHNDPVNRSDPFGLADLLVVIWNANPAHTSVGHVYVQNLSATGTGNPNPAISSPFPANGGAIGANVQKNLAEAKSFEGRAPDQTFIVKTDPKNDAAVDRTMRDHATRPTWKLVPDSNDTTNCSVAASAILRAGGYKDPVLSAAAKLGVPVTPNDLGKSLSASEKSQALSRLLGIKYPEIKKQ